MVAFNREIRHYLRPPRSLGELIPPPPRLTPSPRSRPQNTPRTRPLPLSQPHQRPSESTIKFQTSPHQWSWRSNNSLPKPTVKSRRSPVLALIATIQLTLGCVKILPQIMTPLWIYRLSSNNFEIYMSLALKSLPISAHQRIFHPGTQARPCRSHGGRSNPYQHPPSR